jgi:hypothetical protein
LGSGLFGTFGMNRRKKRQKAEKIGFSLRVSRVSSIFSNRHIWRKKWQITAIFGGNFSKIG